MLLKTNLITARGAPLPKSDEEILQVLMARRRDLEDLESATSEARQPVELDQTRVGRLSRMDALQSQAMSIETDRRRRVELQRIDSALQRLRSGDYGYCVACGEEISPKRLEFDPAVPTCISCAKHSKV